MDSHQTDGESQFPTIFWCQAFKPVTCYYYTSQH